ncbi:polysaccharide pyruvyl transferase family protein [Aeromicrobium wangtongii]|uniref:Polysaccharide pyruvyl transferase family protein n=1 Tax=Aeromicrobium wangtongii TaxID=2969247 RepID=A0ABY5MDE1_9ACTN|nr:polysaccharide pyruvyl transferase family protein [Aeromicrobium wangtongii]MCD9199488.1 polysaccharide pyruvyl transferase family protein [Aeromicrobium wangtongii]UUP13841.1 polysaccharide pyruvyl transferase family protein [Aeromicrobium wangtongii]
MIERGYASSLSRIRGVDVVHWNPKYRLAVRGRTLANLPWRANNFGDLLGPLIVDKLLDRQLTADMSSRPTRVTTVGSILHFAQQGDTVWGTGVNGKVDSTRHRFTSLDVRAVRGPRTAHFLEQRGLPVDVPYGDPALLLPDLFPDLRHISETKLYKQTVVPNLNDLPLFRGHPDLLDPRSPVMTCLRRIVQSEFVVGSSLHAMIVSEAFGIDFVLLDSRSESPFKFHDYAEGTNRRLTPRAADLASAPSAPRMEPLDYASTPLLNSFPYDLWGPAE